MGQRKKGCGSQWEGLKGRIYGLGGYNGILYVFIICVISYIICDWV